MAGTAKQMREIGANTRFNGERAAKAGRKSAETRVQIGRLKHAAEEVVTPEKAREIIAALADKAACGDVQASTFLRDLLGEKPKEQIEQTINEIAFRIEGVSPEEADEISG
jgi:hypothetical protein